VQQDGDEGRKSVNSAYKGEPSRAKYAISALLTAVLISLDIVVLSLLLRIEMNILVVSRATEVAQWFQVAGKDLS
jgi:hypothetical protein